MLLGCDVKIFEAIGYNVEGGGRVVAVDTKIMNNDCLEYGRMMMEVTNPSTIAGTVFIVSLDIRERCREPV